MKYPFLMAVKVFLLIAVTMTPACAGDSAPPAPQEPNVTPAVAVDTAAPKPVHFMTDTSKLIPLFKNALRPRVEYRAIVEMENGDVFEMLFYPETAPNHVANFVTLAKRGFYDGVTFHRVIDNFMAQGGDPTATGGGGPGYAIAEEFSALPHNRGTISMARTSDPNSAGSQFFICFKRLPFLDRQYTIFGEVVKGMEAVDRIKRRDPQQAPNFRGDAIKKVTIVETEAPLEVAAARVTRRNRSTVRRTQRLLNETNEPNDIDNTTPTTD